MMIVFFLLWWEIWKWWKLFLNKFSKWQDKSSLQIINLAGKKKDKIVGRMKELKKEKPQKKKWF